MSEPIGGGSVLFGPDGTEPPDPLPVLPDALTGPGLAEARPATARPGPVELPAVDPEVRAALAEDAGPEPQPPLRTASHRPAPSPARPPQGRPPLTRASPERHHGGPPDWRHGAPQLAPPMARGLPSLSGAPPMASPPAIQPPLAGPAHQTGSGGRLAAPGPGDSARRYRRASPVPSHSRAGSKVSWLVLLLILVAVVYSLVVGLAGGFG